MTCSPRPRRALAAGFAVLLAALTSGCFVSRQALNYGYAPQGLRALEPGVSTAADVVANLGAPAEVVMLGQRSAYRYERAINKRAGLSLLVLTMIGEDSRADRVWVFFDEADVLSHVAVNLASQQAEYGLPVFSGVKDAAGPATVPGSEDLQGNE
jgi:outer membrane protein assembly factor BamE (lipoprotein component of BamABCDE complex)